MSQPYNAQAEVFCGSKACDFVQLRRLHRRVRQHSCCGSAMWAVCYEPFGAFRLVYIITHRKCKLCTSCIVCAWYRHIVLEQKVARAHGYPWYHFCGYLTVNACEQWFPQTLGSQPFRIRPGVLQLCWQLKSKP